MLIIRWWTGSIDEVSLDTCEFFLEFCEFELFCELDLAARGGLAGALRSSELDWELPDDLELPVDLLRLRFLRFSFRLLLIFGFWIFCSSHFWSFSSLIWSRSSWTIHDWFSIDEENNHVYHYILTTRKITKVHKCVCWYNTDTSCPF